MRRFKRAAIVAGVILGITMAATSAATLRGCAPARDASTGGDVSPVVIYLCTDDMAYLVPVSLELPAGVAMRESARLVVEWPGGGAFRSPFPEGSRLRSVAVDGVTAHARVTAGDGVWDEGRQARARESLTFTLTGFPGVRRVLLDAGPAGKGSEPRPPFINQTGPAPWDCSMKMVLWFAYKGSYLVPVTRFVPKSAFPHSSAIQQLIAGPPEGTTLSRTIPEGTRLLAVLVEKGVCTVDVSTRSALAGTSGAAESLALQSIALTLTEFPDVRSVRMLIDGKPGGTLGGHVVLDRPLERGMINLTRPGAN